MEFDVVELCLEVIHKGRVSPRLQKQANHTGCSAPLSVAPRSSLPDIYDLQLAIPQQLDITSRFALFSYLLCAWFTASTYASLFKCILDLSPYIDP